MFLMTSVRDLMTQEGAAIACAKRRDALYFIRFMIEQMSASALNTCIKMLKKSDERAKALLLLALLDMHQSKPMRVNMKEPVELEPMRKIDKIRRFSNKELRITKESMGALPKSSDYCGPIRKKSYSYVCGIIGMAYNPFLNEDIRDCSKCKILSAVPERTKEELESILGTKFMGCASGNFSDFERQKQKGSTVTDYNAVDENDEVHRVMMEVGPLLEASGKRN